MAGEVATSSGTAAETFAAEITGLLALVRGGLEAWRSTHNSDSIAARGMGTRGFKQAFSTLEGITARVQMQGGYELQLAVGDNVTVNGHHGLPTYIFARRPHGFRTISLRAPLLPGESLPIKTTEETIGQEEETDNAFIGKYSRMVSLKDLAEVLGQGCTWNLVKLDEHEAIIPRA